MTSPSENRPAKCGAIQVPDGAPCVLPFAHDWPHRVYRTQAELLEAQLIEHEGLRLKPYRCPAGKLTIGVGRNLEDVGISQAEAMLMLHNDIAAATADLVRFTWYDQVGPVRLRALIDMRINLGPGRFRGFRRMLEALERGDYQAAALEMRTSVWAAQVGARAERLARMMETGQDA